MSATIGVNEAADYRRSIEVHVVSKNIIYENFVCTRRTSAAVYRDTSPSPAFHHLSAVNIAV